MTQLPLPSSNLPCGFCKDLWVSPKYFGNNDRQSFTVTRTVHEWTTSADLGCPLCWWILHSPHCYQRTEWSMRMNFDLAPGLRLLTFEIFRSADESILILGPKEISEERQKLVILKLVADQGNPAASRIKLRPAPSASAEGTLQKAREWLDECRIVHSSTCPEPESSFMPLRLLDVTVSPTTSSHSPTASNTLLESTVTDRVYLYNNVDGSAASQSYAALTYCWGKPGSPLYTTRSNVESFTTEGIPLAQVPQTIQDAVTVTRKLGLRFLWIDAFCIAQDDEEEKAVEISRMASIYRNARVTISAAAASKVQDGFLGKREVWSAERLAPIYLPWKMSEDSEMGTIGLLHNIMTPLSFQDPIHLRAWTMQETLLSTRVLVFSKQQVYFTCLGYWIKTIGGNQTAINRLRRPMKVESKKSKGTAWNDIIAEYSARGLSFAGDKLLALSSIASMYGKPEDYLAGLWRDELPRNLLWKPNGEADNCRRNRDGRAPSWSWMSVDGPVNAVDQDIIIAGFLQSIIKDCQTTPKHAFNKFGLVTEATLTVQGLLVDIALDPKTRKIYHFKGANNIPGDPERIIGEVSFDSLDDKQEVEQAAALTADNRAILTALPLFVIEKLHKRTTAPIGRAVAGLVLEVGTDGAWYKRIGTFESLSSTMVDFCQDALGLMEYDISTNYDYSHYLVDPSASSYDTAADEVVHEGVKCNGALCRKEARSSSHRGIKGPRYWCRECKMSYCGWCKNDPSIHYNELHDAKESFHRYARLPLPVKESMFEAQDWRKHVVEIPPPSIGITII